MTKILISCSMKRIEDARQLAENLEQHGHTVVLPTTKSMTSKRAHIDRHREELDKADMLLLANFPEKNSSYGRVGASGFFEVGWAYALGKPAYYLNPLDPDSPYTEDIEAVALKFDEMEQKEKL